MTKIKVEVCIISAHGLRRPPSLMKPQWFAVGWINSNDKYCTKIDSTGGSNPTWKTKFSLSLDNSNSNVHGLSLTIEVHRIEAIFLREKLQGTATVPLNELFVKFARERDFSGTGIEETRTFQLKRKNSSKPRGFVDVSVSISEGREDVTPYSGTGEDSWNSQNEIQLTIQDGTGFTPSSHQYQLPGNSRFTTQPERYSNRSPSRTGFRQARTPPPPPAPANEGFMATWFPGTGQPQPDNFKYLPQIEAAGRNARPENTEGLGDGAMSAVAAIFGDDYMSPKHHTL